MNQPHPVYSKDAAVHVITGANKIATLDAALEASSFFRNLEVAWELSGKQRDEFAIAVKPNIMTASVHQDEPNTYTDPALVEHLFARMRERGFARFAVV